MISSPNEFLRSLQGEIEGEAEIREIQAFVEQNGSLDIQFQGSFHERI